MSGSSWLTPWLLGQGNAGGPLSGAVRMRRCSAVRGALCPLRGSDLMRGVFRTQGKPLRSSLQYAATAFIFYVDSENESHTLGFVERARITPRGVPTLGLLIKHPLTGRSLHLHGSPSLWQAFKGC